MFLISKDYWEVKNTQHKGRGVFAKQTIPPGAVLGDFIGKILRPEQDIVHGPTYSMHYSDQSIIMPDPTKEGIHLVNHSCMPTCDMFPYKGHALLFALRKIFPGEELTFQYLIDPPTDGKEPSAMYPCNCGARLCHGTMNTTKDISEKTAKFIHDMDGNFYENNLPVPYDQEIPVLDAYPEFIEDYPIYDLCGSTLFPPVEIDDEKIESIQYLRKQIRETGKILNYKKLNIQVIGIMDELIISKI